MVLRDDFYHRLKSRPNEFDLLNRLYIEKQIRNEKIFPTPKLNFCVEEVIGKHHGQVFHMLVKNEKKHVSSCKDLSTCLCRKPKAQR